MLEDFQGALHSSVVSNSVRPHRRQLTRLLHPRDSPGKNTGVACHFILQCMKVKRESEDAQSCLTPSDPMDRSLPGSSIHGIFQARVLEWGAIAFSNTLLVGVQNDTITLEGTLVVSYRIKYVPWYLPKEAENLCQHKNQPTATYSSFLFITVKT